MLTFGCEMPYEKFLVRFLYDFPTHIYNYIFFQCKSFQDVSDLTNQPRLIMLWLQVDTWTEGCYMNYQNYLPLLLLLLQWSWHLQRFCWHCGWYSCSLLFDWAKEFSSFLLYQPVSSMTEVFLTRLWLSLCHYGFLKRIWLLFFTCSDLGGHGWVQTSRRTSCFHSLT